MIYNYIPGTNETLTLQSIGQNDGSNTVIKADGFYTNIISDLILYTDSSGTTFVPGAAYSETGEDTQVTALEVGQSDKTAYKTYIVTDPAYQNIDLWATFTNFGTYTDNQAAVDWMSESRDIYNPRRFNADRIDSQELTSGTLTTSGWYTIAETKTVGNHSGLSSFKTYFTGSAREAILGYTVGLVGSGTTRTTSNSEVKIDSFVCFNEVIYKQPNVRLAKSDSVSDSGAKIQIYLDISVGVGLTTQLNCNIGKLKGWELVTPYLDNTPTLPDGVTVGTFIEAGAELSFKLLNGAFQASGVKWYKGSSNDQIRVVIDWPELPKQGTGITITGTTANINIKGYDSSTGASLGSFSISNIIFDDKKLYFNINQTGIATSLTNFEGGYFIFQSDDIVFTITG